MSTNSTMGTYIATNYRRAQAPFSRLGTRQLKFYSINVFGVNMLDPDFGGDDGNSYYTEDSYGVDHSDYNALPENSFKSDSVFFQALNGVMMQSEVYWYGHPEYYSGQNAFSAFPVMVAYNTNADGEADWFMNPRDSQESMAQAVWRATGEQYEVNVYNMEVWGDFDVDNVSGGNSLKAAKPAGGKTPPTWDHTKGFVGVDKNGNKK